MGGAHSQSAAGKGPVGASVLVPGHLQDAHHEDVHQHLAPVLSLHALLPVCQVVGLRLSVCLSICLSVNLSVCRSVSTFVSLLSPGLSELLCMSLFSLSVYSLLCVTLKFYVSISIWVFFLSFSLSLCVSLSIYNILPLPLCLSYPRLSYPCPSSFMYFFPCF